MFPNVGTSDVNIRGGAGSLEAGAVASGVCFRQATLMVTWRRDGRE